MIHNQLMSLWQEQGTTKWFLHVCIAWRYNSFFWKGRITVETLRSHCHTYQVYVNDTWVTSTDNNSPASTEESTDILLFPLSAYVTVCVSIVAHFSACQRIFVFDFHTVLHPLLVSDAPKPPYAFWGVWIWTQHAFSLTQTTAEILVDNWQNRKTAPFSLPILPNAGTREINAHPDWRLYSGY